MIKKNIHIPLYGFNITYLEIESKSDVSDVRKEMNKLNANKEQIEEVLDNIINDRRDGGERPNMRVLLMPMLING